MSNYLILRFFYPSIGPYSLITLKFKFIFIFINVQLNNNYTPL